MDEVMKWLMNYCMDHSIGVVYRNNLPEDAPSVSYQNPNLIIFNDQYHDALAKPFILAHEIGHVVNGNPECINLINGSSQEENIADRFAINLLWEYCLDQDIWFDNIYDFATAFCIPNDKYYLLDKEVNYGVL